jgi:hypothetical protein
MQELTFDTQEQEALFQFILKKIPSMTEPKRLKELVKQEIVLLLRRPEDESLRGKLVAYVNEMFSNLLAEPPSTVQKAHVRRAARDCIEVLQAAKEHRMPRDIIYPHGGRSAGVSKKTGRPAPVETKASAKLMGIAAAFATVLVGSIVWQSSQTDRSSIFLDAKTFTAQMIAATTNAEEVESPFGGHVKQKTIDGKVKVVADKVPSRICAASGWQLVHQGILTVNGVTPKRVSSAIITDLCYSAKGEVSIMWEPKGF